MKANGKSKMVLCSHICCGMEDRVSFHQGNSQLFQSPLAASQRRGRNVYRSKGTKLLGGGPNRCREQTGRLQLDMDEVAHKLLIEDEFDSCSVWVFGGGLGAKGQLLSRGLQGTQKHTDWFQIQNTTYSPEKEDPPGTQCTELPTSSHLTSP